MHDPDILVLDEPTSGLDPSYRGILLKQLEQVRKRGGTVLISSHILSDLQKLVDAVTLINKGKIVYTGKKPADIEEMYEKMVSKKKITDKEGQTCLVVSGKLILTPERAQSCELLVAKIELVNSTANDYPLQKKNIPLEVVRNFPHLRTKTNYFLALFRLRHNVSQAIQEFFHQEGFYCVPTPLITSNDTEGAGELFNITTNEKEPFFPKPAKLTVSGQLQAEALAQGLGKVYTFSPCFRAEKSHTTRHLAEF
jgi:asparaginyl-tRNA synthetase